MATRKAMADPIFTRLAGRPPALVIDLTRIEFLGLAGISILLETQSRALGSTTTLRIVATTPVVLRPLAAVGLLSTLPICRTMTEALDSIDRGAVQAGRGSLVQAQ
jgi:anti-anti-sigma factor